MHYYVRVGGESVEVAIEEREEELVAIVAGRGCPIDHVASGTDGLHTFRVGGTWHTLVARRSTDPAQSVYHVVYRGSAYEAVVEDELEHGSEDLEAARPGVSARRVVRSVMPGIVVKVVVSEGARVAPGAPLLLLEAMKMENEIASEVKGVIERVLVEAGQSVGSGQELVVIRTA